MNPIAAPAPFGNTGMQREVNTFFSQVYVINLTSRVDRRVEMDAQLQRIGLSLKHPHVVVFEATKPTEPAGFPSVGTRGCFMSHLSILRQARDNALASVLILEDDLNFCDNFPAKFKAIADFLDTAQWGMFYGSYHLEQPLPRSDSPCLKVVSELAIGTSALLAVRGPHIGALVDYLEAMLLRPAGDPDGGPMHIDGAYCWFRRAHPEVLCWLSSRPLGFQRSSKTDVHTLRWFDRSWYSAALVATLRRLLNHFRR